MRPPLVEYRHPGIGFRLSLPSGWERAENARGVALIAIEPDRGPWFRANAVVTVDRIDPRLSESGWREHNLALMREALREFQLIDLAETALGRRPAWRLLAHHRAETELAIHAVTLEQWTIVEGPLGYTVTASMATLEYDQLADWFAEMASSLRPDPEYRP